MDKKGQYLSLFLTMTLLLILIFTITYSPNLFQEQGLWRGILILFKQNIPVFIVLGVLVLCEYLPLLGTIILLALAVIYIILLRVTGADIWTIKTWKGITIFSLLGFIYWIRWWKNKNSM